MPYKEIKDSGQSGVNFVCLISSVFITLIFYLAQRNGVSFVNTEDYFTTISMAALLISLPDLLANSVIKLRAWYITPAVITILLIVVLACCGILTTFNIGPFHYLRYAIWGGGIFLFLLELFNLKHGLDKSLLLAGPVVITGLIISQYSQTYQSLGFEEKILDGVAHVDTLFHMAISNMFATGEWSTTGLHGTAYMHYHWFSHATFAGIKNLTGGDIHVIYNLFYPAVFIPLFFKIQYKAIVDFCQWKGFAKISPLAYFTFSAVLYWLVNLGFLSHVQPFSSESFCLSLILSYCYFSCLMEYRPASVTKRIWLYIFSALLVLIILFTKISNGFILLAGLVAIGALRDFHLPNLLVIFILLVIILIPSYLFLFPLARTTVSISLIERVYRFLLGTNGGFIFLPGMLLLFSSLFRKPAGQSYKSFLWELSKSDIGFLAVLLATGFLCGVYVSNNDADVFYFVAVQFFYAIIYIFGYLHEGIKKRNLQRGKKTALFMLFAIMATFSHPKVWLQVTKELKKEAKKSPEPTSDRHYLLKSLAVLQKLEDRPDKSSIAIYIPPTEEWLHRSQHYRPLANLFIVPAYSGIASVGGIPDSLLKANYNYYSIYYYRDQPSLFSVSDINSAKKAAADLGYKLLVVLRVLNGELVVEYNDLKELRRD